MGSVEDWRINHLVLKHLCGIVLAAASKLTFAEVKKNVEILLFPCVKNLSKGESVAFRKKCRLPVQEHIKRASCS